MKESMCIQKIVPCTSLYFKINEFRKYWATYLLVCVDCSMCRQLEQIHLPWLCMFGQNTSYLDKNKHQKNLLNASHVDRWNAKTKKFNWEAQTLQKMQKKKIT